MFFKTKGLYVIYYVILTGVLMSLSCVPSKIDKTDKDKVVPSKADNAECLICHLDFKSELISSRHEKEGVGCTYCHGQSLAHGDDESNIIKPDLLFGRAEIRDYCKQCHPVHRKTSNYNDFVKKWYGKRRPNGRIVTDDSACTDCHGNHAVLRVDQM
ncbi:MAG: cytochrome c3 family protein [Planctomycetota bacterium]|jgi:hypothetical protein